MVVLLNSSEPDERTDPIHNFLGKLHIQQQQQHTH